MIDTPIRSRTRMVQPPAAPAIRVRQRPGAIVARPKPPYWPNGSATYEHGGKVLLGYAFKIAGGGYEVWSAKEVYLGSTPVWDFGAQVALMRKAL